MASDGCSYLEEYAEYFKKFQEFVAKLNYEDDLLPSNLKCRSGQEELIGECVEWTLRYLRLTNCPQSLLPFITKSALDRVRLNIDDYTQEGVLAPNMVEIVNEVCLQYCGEDNPALRTLPSPPSVPTPVMSACAIRNTRRRMENRHAIVEDLDTIFNISSSRPTHYYGVFDGHSGVDAATYCSTHMHCFIAQSPNYPSDPERALKDAFARTESLFTDKCNQENINGGCTALCVLYRPVDRQLFAAWAGDSQAIVVSPSKIIRLVNPHKPDRVDERLRIEQAGGVVLFYGTWRVNGQLAVSRAIGDVKHKDFVSGVPEISSVSLSGDEDFLVLGCDGLWDSVKEVDVAATVYEQLQNEPSDAGELSKSVVSLARNGGSSDNISVVVVLLKPAGLIAPPPPPPSNKEPELVAAFGRPQGPMDILDAVDNANNPFLPTNGLRDDGGLIGAFDNSPSEERGVVRQKDDDDDEDDEDDMGPETDVDAVDDDADEVDDVLVSPTTASIANMAASNPFLEKTSLDTHEVLALALGTGDDDQPASLEPLDPLSSSQLAKGGAEVDNVGESGEESEEEWNYYRVEPTGEKASAPQDLDSGASEDMESQLNPNAAVFIPSSPTENSNHIEQPFNENLTQEEFFNKVDVMSSSFIAHDPVAEVEAMNGKDDEVWLSSSPKKGGVPLDNVCVPPEEEFDREVSQRPGDLDVESHNAMNGESVQNGQKIVDDLLAGEKETVSAVENLNPFAAPVSPKPCLNLMDSEFSISGEENGENVMIALEVSPPVEPANEIPLMEPANEIPLMEPGNENPFMEPVNGNPLMEPPNDKAPIEPLNEDSYVEHVNQDSCMEAIMEEPVMESGAEEPIEEAIVEPVAEEPVMESCNEPILETVEEPANEELVVQSTNEVQFEGAEVAGMTEFEQIAETVVEAQPDAQSQIIPDISEDAVFVENAVAGVDLLSAVEECNGNFDTSPIVSSATGFGEHLGTCTNSSHVLSFNDISSEPLNDAVIYSTSGFDNMMSAPSRNVDSAMERASAQSTPFEGEPFDFEAGNYGKKGDQPNQEEPNVFTQLTEVEIHSHFDQEDDLIGDVSAKSELNHRFTEDSAIIQSQEIGGGSQFPVMSEIQGYTFAENQEPASKVEVTDIPEVEVIDLCEEKVDDFSSQQGFNESQSPVVTRTQEFVFGENQEPTVSTGEITDIPKAEGIINSYGEEIDSIVEFEPSPAVNGSESPDVVVPATPVPENPIEKESASELHLDSSAPEPIAEEQVVEIEPKIETEIAEQIAASTEAEDNTNQAASIAAVGAAAAAAIGVAATVAASKTDKKPGSKAPITKAKPLPASKAPAKPSTKAGAPTSTTAPKRPAATAPPVPAARAAPRTTAATKPKPSDSVIKSSATAGPKPAPPKPRTTVSAAKPATTDKKPLTNGDLSKAATAPKPTARPSTTRPLTAPARTSKPAAATSAPAKTAATATAAPAPARPPPIRRMPAATTTAATAPKPKPAVPESKPRPSTATGVAAKSRPATTNSVSSAKSSVASARAAPASKPVDKQTKETTNKLISATRSTVSRTTTASKTTASKTLSAMTTGTAKPSNTGKPVPIKKVPATSGSTKAPVGLLGKKPIEKPKAVMTNGNLKNGHASPEESPVQNGVSHDEPVMEKKESDLKVESLIDNQLVA